MLVSNGTSSGHVVINALKGSLFVTRPAMVHYIHPRAHILEMANEVFALVKAGQIVSEPKQIF
jgi:NADPH2:quinone reductase